jgi:hypothetical protein
LDGGAADDAGIRGTSDGGDGMTNATSDGGDGASSDGGALDTDGSSGGSRGDATNGGVSTGAIPPVDAGEVDAGTATHDGGWWPSW